MIYHVRLSKLRLFSSMRALASTCTLLWLLSCERVFIDHSLLSFSLWFYELFLKWCSWRMIIWRKFFLFILIIVRLIGLILLLFCYLLSLFVCGNSFLQWMWRLVCVWVFHCSMISRRFASCSLLWHWTLISVMKWLSFLKIWNSRLFLRFFILNINVVIICVSCVHLIRHVKATEIRRNKLPTCNLRTSLLIRHYACMYLTTSILTCFHLS